MKPKIVTFAPLPPSRVGGVEEYAYSVVNEIQRAGIDLTIVTSQFQKAESNPSEFEEYIFIPSTNFYDRPLPKSLGVFVRVIREIRHAQLIHIHMSYPILEAFASLVSKLLGKKVIVTYHADAKIDAESQNQRKLKHLLIETAYLWLSAKWALRLCDLICTNTMGYARTSPVLKQYLKKIEIVHQGIRRSLFDHFDRDKALMIRSDYLGTEYTHIIAFVGRLVPYKGLRYLIEAAHILSGESDKKILFLLGGNGPEREQLINTAREYGLRNVIFLGYVKDEDFLNLFGASDLVVSPSISNLESTPISLLYALALGVPVIGTLVGGTEETIPNDGKMGSLIPPKDSRILAEKIDSMLNNTKKISSPKVSASSRFWSDVANDYLNIFYKILQNDDKLHNLQ